MSASKKYAKATATLFVVALCGCCHTEERVRLPNHPVVIDRGVDGGDGFVRIGESYNLTEQEIDSLKDESLSSNGASAAWSLYQYYLFYKNDKSRAIIWRKRAAELGYEVARRLIDEERYRLTWEENMSIYPEIYGGDVEPDSDSFEDGGAFQVETAE